MASRKEKEASVIGIEPAKKPDRPAPVPAVTKAMAEGLVGFVQVVLRALPWTRDDVLSDVEQKVLVADVVAFAKVNPWFARGCVWLLAQTSMGALPFDVGAVAAKRLAKHDLAPAEVALVADLAIAVSAQAHEIPIDADLAALTSLFGGLSPDATLATTEIDAEGTPDLAELVSTDLEK